VQFKITVAYKFILNDLEDTFGELHITEKFKTLPDVEKRLANIAKHGVGCWSEEGGKSVCNQILPRSIVTLTAEEL
jgi:hypothetical protein